MDNIVCGRCSVNSQITKYRRRIFKKILIFFVIWSWKLRQQIQLQMNEKNISKPHSHNYNIMWMQFFRYQIKKCNYKCSTRNDTPVTHETHWSPDNDRQLIKLVTRDSNIIAVQSQNAVSACITGKQILPFWLCKQMCVAPGCLRRSPDMLFFCGPPPSCILLDQRPGSADLCALPSNKGFLCFFYS